MPFLNSEVSFNLEKIVSYFATHLITSIAKGNKLF